MQPATAMPSANMRRAALLVAALLALLWQSFVVQTHVHPAAFAGSPKVENSWQGPLLHRGKASDRGDNCALCQELAYSGAYLVGAAVPVIIQAAAQFLPAEPQILLGTAFARSHSWRSRAPPLSLQS